MNTSRRTQKMASSLRSELGRILGREIADPRLREIVVTDVELTGDLRNAKIFYGCGSVPHKDAQLGLRKAVPFLRRRIGECLEVRHVPDLSFEYDRHNENLTHLLGVISNLPPAGGMPEATDPKVG